MAESARIAFPASVTLSESSSERAAAVPWYVWSSALAVTSTTVGLYWDISWHMGIGRDTFWTPAHLAIQFGAVLTGLCCAYLILHTTFWSDAAAREHTVQIWGFRGPLGAFIAAWGGFCMSQVLGVGYGYVGNALNGKMALKLMAHNKKIDSPSVRLGCIRYSTNVSGRCPYCRPYGTVLFARRENDSFYAATRRFRHGATRQRLAVFTKAECHSSTSQRVISGLTFCPLVVAGILGRAFSLASVTWRKLFGTNQSSPRKRGPSLPDRNAGLHRARRHARLRTALSCSKRRSP